MKIPASIRQLHESLQDELHALAEYSDEVLKRFVTSRRWFYESRIKTLESFALKLETGRVSVPANMEDLFGATIVVQNKLQVEAAVSLLQSDLGVAIAYRRPTTSKTTEKDPASFQFDDVRLYVRHAQPRGNRPRPELDRVFEIQVKTLLQHGWGIATHDAIYKGPAISWGRERVGFQARAILEHVENSIAALGPYEEAVGFPAFRPYEFQNAALQLIATWWPPERLPADTRRLSAIVADVLSALELTVDNLAEALASAAAKGEGHIALDLSPYQAVVTALFDLYPERFTARMGKGRRLKLCVTPELLAAKPALSSLPAEFVVNVTGR